METSRLLFLNLHHRPAVNDLASLIRPFRPIIRRERISLLGRHLLSTVRN